MLQRYFVIRHENTDITEPPTFTTRMDKLRILVGVLLRLAALLCLTCFLCILIAATAFSFLPGMTLHALKRIRRLVVGVCTSIRSLCISWRSFIANRRFQNQSVQNHDLWDRWLDGI